MRFAVPLFTAAALSACAAPAPRSIQGTAPSGAVGVMAIDVEGATTQTEPAADGTWRLEPMGKAPYHVFVTDADGQIRVMKFSGTAIGPADHTMIPQDDGAITVAQLSTCDCDADGEEDDDALEAGENPLGQIDTDDDGATDDADSDDDGDGTSDDADSDDDGDGTSDDDQDLDEDSDGSLDPIDDDDDGDGVDDDGDEEDEDGGADDESGEADESDAGA